MARRTTIEIRKRKPDYGTGIAILVMLGFVIAAGFGFVPSWLQ